MPCTDLPLVRPISIHAGIRLDLSRTVIFGYVRLELLNVSPWRGFPARLLLQFIEIVRKVLGLRVANFPASWETGVSLLLIVSKVEYMFRKSSKTVEQIEYVI